MEPVYFATQGAFREWLATNHDSAVELWVGFYKKASGKPTVTYSEALDEALCFGWIDGVRRAVDGERFMQRFTPRRPGSKWSAINLRRAAALIEEGRMQPPGVAAFEARDPDGAAYTHERGDVSLSAEYEASLKSRPEAWAFFQAQPPWYQRTASAWVMDAKQEQTRLRRLEMLASDSEAGAWIRPLRFARRDKK